METVHAWEVRTFPGKKAYKRCAACGMKTDLASPPAHPCPGKPFTGSGRTWVMEDGSHRVERSERMAKDYTDGGPWEAFHDDGSEDRHLLPSPEALARALHQARQEQAIYANYAQAQEDRLHFDLTDPRYQKLAVAAAEHVLDRWATIIYGEVV